MKLAKTTLACISILTIGMISTPANATSLIGNTVTCANTGQGNFTCSVPQSTVGSGVEFSVGNSSQQFINANFDSTGLSLSALRDGSLGNAILTFSDLTSKFTSFSLNSQSGFKNYDVASSALLNGNLSIDLSGVSFKEENKLRFALTTSSAVPEPATWAMLLVGFGMMGFAMRKRSNVCTAVAYA